ncbi:MAG: hypothetical protein HC809_07620 [Gammaproteobacteria bacterium]|nr:hypothetical protein [Gammaproteobacteria bacterium]
MWLSTIGATLRARRSYVGFVANEMGAALHEPAHNARRLALEHAAAMRHSARETSRMLKALTAGRVPDLPTSTRAAKRIASLVDYVQCEPSPKVVMCMHTAGFLQDALRMLLRLPAAPTSRCPCQRARCRHCRRSSGSPRVEVYGCR